VPRFDAIQRLWLRLVATDGRDTVLDTDSFTESERAVGRMAIPLIEDLRAAREQIEHLEARVKAIDAVLTLLPTPAIVLDEEGRLLSRNQAARDLFGGPAVPESVVAAAAHAVQAEGAARAPHPAGRSRTLRIVPAQRGGGPAVVFLIAADYRPSIVSPKTLQDRLHLTKQQAAVVSLVEGNECGAILHSKASVRGGEMAAGGFRGEVQALSNLAVRESLRSRGMCSPLTCCSTVPEVCRGGLADNVEPPDRPSNDRAVTLQRKLRIITASEVPST
jgi:PAS domain-containing protein